MEGFGTRAMPGGSGGDEQKRRANRPGLAVRSQTRYSRSGATTLETQEAGKRVNHVSGSDRVGMMAPKIKVSPVQP